MNSPNPVWIIAAISNPPVGEFVLTYGSYGFVVAEYLIDGTWQAQYTDNETGEPWLQDEADAPTHWMPLPQPPNGTPR